jgi:hypothetical protein
VPPIKERKAASLKNMHRLMHRYFLHLDTTPLVLAVVAVICRRCADCAPS